MTDVYDCTLDYTFEARTDIEPKRALTEEEQQTLKEVVYDLILILDTHSVRLGSETYFRLNDQNLCLVFPRSKSADSIEVWDAIGTEKYGYMLPQNKT